MIILIFGVLLSYSDKYGNWPPKKTKQQTHSLAVIISELKTKHFFIVSPFYTSVQKSIIEKTKIRKSPLTVYSADHSATQKCMIIIYDSLGIINTFRL